MGQKKLIIRINKKGEVKIEAKGFEGQECLLATEPFEKALGNVSEREMKPEQEIVKERQSLGN